MAVVTFNGPVGAGGVEVGALVASQLNMDYWDRLILAEKAKRLGATVEAVADKEARIGRVRDRIARFLQTMLERSALSGAGGEPYFGPGYDVLLARDYTEVAAEPITTAQQLDDKRFFEVTKAVVLDLARSGNVVINGRGSNIILQDMPGVLHVGLLAHMDRRVRTLMEREHLSEAEARSYATRMERARLAFFRKFFHVDPNHPSHYHLMLNMDRLDVAGAVEIVVLAAKGLVH